VRVAALGKNNNEAAASLTASILGSSVIWWGMGMTDHMRRPLTELSFEDRLGLAPLFSMRAQQEWPTWTLRVLRALRLPEETKFELCWEEYNLISRNDRDRVFRTLDVPGSILVPLDNPPMRGLTKLIGWVNPVSWVMRPIDRKIITPLARKALAPLMTIAADLPSSSDRNKDARAWRRVLSFAPAKIAAVIIRILIVDIAGDLYFGDTAAADTASASQYDPSAVDYDTGAVDASSASSYTATTHHDLGHTGHSASHLAAEVQTAGSAAMHQVAGAFHPLIAAVQHAHAHSPADAAKYADEVVRAAHQSMHNLPPDLRHTLHAIKTVSMFGWTEKDRPFVTFTAF